MLSRSSHSSPSTSRSTSIAENESLESLNSFAKKTEGHTDLSTESGQSISGSRRYLDLESLAQRRLTYCSLAILTSNPMSHLFKSHLYAATSLLRPTDPRAICRTLRSRNYGNRVRASLTEC